MTAAGGKSSCAARGGVIGMTSARAMRSPITSSKRLRTLIFLVAIAMPLVCGCSSILPPRADPTKFYVLTPIAGVDSNRPESWAAHPLAVGLGPIKFPDYLTHLEVVTRVSSNRIEMSPTDQWAEPLDESFRRVLAVNLATLLGTDQVVPFPWYASVKLDYRIEVTVMRFERDGSGGTTLAANWLIRGGHGDQPLVSRQSNFHVSEGLLTSAAERTTTTDNSIDDAAAALSADLSDLSKQIAAAVTALNSARDSRVAN
jgi:uncharacterized protein